MANRTHRPGLAQRGQREPWLLTLSLGVLGGLLLALAFPPWGTTPLAFIGPALLVVAIDGAPSRRRLLGGFLFGVAFFAPVLWWVERVGVDAWVLLVAVEAAFAALFALAAGPVLAHPRPIVGPWDGPVCGSWCSRQLGPGSPWEAFPGDRSALPWWGLLSSA